MTTPTTVTYTIQCSDPLHSTRSQDAGFSDNLGDVTYPYGTPEPDWSSAGYFCDACAAQNPLLEIVKQAKFAEIDARTDALCDSGFEFPPASGLRFSLSLAAQAKMLGLDALRLDVNLVYPIDYNTIDDTGVLSVTDAVMVHNFFLTAVGTYRGIIDAGTTLKDQVRAATTPAAVRAISDQR